MRKNLLITPVAVLLVAGAMQLSAQDYTTGTLAGRVTGSDGKPLQGVSVTLNSPALLAPRQFTTDANGQFRAQMLIGGNYTITYTLSGYLTRRMTTYITAGQVIRGDMQLKAVDMQTAEVEISAAPTSSQQVDKTDTIVQTSYSRDKMLELFGGTSVGDLMAVSAGLIQNEGGGDDYRVRGGTTRGTKFLIDGGNVTNMMEGSGYAVVAPLTDAIESIAVMQSPMNPRYGNTDGGMISYVLAKGSNEFRGSMRVYLDRQGLWDSFEARSRTNNRGEGGGIRNPSSDNLSKSYSFYLSGPLWKNHVTFTWSSQISPPSRGYQYQYQKTGSIWVENDGSGYDRSRYRLGTYYKNWDTGEVIRKAEMLEATDPYHIIPWSHRSKNDAYTLFFQLTQNHQLEWSYAESGDHRRDGAGGAADGASNPVLETWGGLVRRWNLAYKGIIGSSGLLEFRITNSTQSWYNVMANGSPKRVVTVRTMDSLIPFRGDDVNDPNNYYSSGLLDALLNRVDSVKDNLVSGGATAHTTTYNFNANNNGPGDSGVNNPISLNYQHMLQTTRGQHMIDVGFQRERVSWKNPNLFSGGVNGEMIVTSPGRIALDLQTGDIRGYTGTPLEQYRGKFIVFNTDYATYNSIDPYGFSRYNQVPGSNLNEPTNGNDKLIDWNSGGGWKSEIWPMMSRQYGGSNASIVAQQMSYYLNDLWTINDHHSVMAGVRFDSYRVWDGDSGRDIHSYSQPTLRFDYKFDLFGDQRRVFNVSWGQFHNMMPVSAWAAFVDRGLTTARWAPPNEGTDGRPYLVEFNDIINPDKYKVITDVYYGGVNEVAKDFKGLVSTELTLGARFNIDNGGSLRVSYVTRSWANDYDYFYNGWKPNPVSGEKSFSRILRNTDKVERSYHSVELEWTIPVTKRLDFGGTYTYSRFVTNAMPDDNNFNRDYNRTGVASGLGEADKPDKVPDKRVNYMDYYDELYGSESRDFGYRPMMLRDPEHRFNAYINYDLTYGRVKSNVALRFNYVSARPATRWYNYWLGYPTVPGVNDANGSGLRDNLAGVGRAQTPNRAGLEYYVKNYMNIHRTAGPDGWDTYLTYNLEVPVTHKLRWFTIITSGNPFNHIAKGTGWYSTGIFASGNIRPNIIYNPNGTINQNVNQPYQTGGFYWREGINSSNSNNLFAPNQVVGDRWIGLSTGLRF